MTASEATDDGSALVEFVYLAVLLLIPLVYVVLTAISVQRTAFGLTAAARDAGRAYATAGSDRSGEARAEASVRIALHDQGVDWSPDGRVVQCQPCDYAPGSQFTVTVHSDVSLPLVPSWMCSGQCVAGIRMTAHHTEQLGCFSGTSDTAPVETC